MRAECLLLAMTQNPLYRRRQTTAVPAFGVLTKYIAPSLPVAVWILVCPHPFRNCQALVQQVWMEPAMRRTGVS